MRAKDESCAICPDAMVKDELVLLRCINAFRTCVSSIEPNISGPLGADHTRWIEGVF